MATAPIVIPGALTKLADGVVLNATITTAQSLFTPPAGMKCVITQVVFRDASASIHPATTVSVGANGTGTAYVSAGAQLQSMAAGNAVIAAYVASATAKPYALPGNDVTVTFGGTLTNNGTVKCDVLGYIEAP